MTTGAAKEDMSEKSTQSDVAHQIAEWICMVEHNNPEVAQREGAAKIRSAIEAAVKENDAAWKAFQAGRGAAERERCASVAETYVPRQSNTTLGIIRDYIAAAIRNPKDSA